MHLGIDRVLKTRAWSSKYEYFWITCWLFMKFRFLLDILYANHEIQKTNDDDDDDKSGKERQINFPYEFGITIYVNNR